MMSLRLAGLLFLGLWAQAPGNSTSFNIVPGLQFGPVREQTRETELRSLFPGTAVQQAPVYLGEGICTDGTKVFAGTPDEIDVAWQDAGRTRVAFVRTTSPGQWATRGGVRIGTPLTDLERTSGRVVTFSGFGWDYSGGVEWTEATGSLRLRLDIDTADDDKAANAPDAREIFGDKQVRSDHPLIRALRIRVVQLMQVWGNVFTEKDCG